MQRFFAALLAGKLTSAASRDGLLSPQITVIPAKDGMPARSHGLGIGLGTAFGHPWVGHNGGTLGVNVETMAFPDDQTTIIVLANRDPPVAGMVARNVQAMLFDGESCKAKTGG
jgi:CubicO group peptidase (beta-lactamase class C family)